ncbi:MAG: single-stranded-DNA-specific exonuclease RecJ [Chloroflexi bacterium]|nr:single-stranded-DNA-specific exonuclease RecJ [Chloroflexota bacterium]
MTSETRWVLAPEPPPEVEIALQRFPPLWRRLLYARGLTNYAAAKAFLEAHPPPTVEDPFGLQDMEAAVDRLAYALHHHEPIAVYGDYDVDGVTATALMVQVLQALGGNVRPYIPNRFDEGYGVHADALRRLYEDGVRLVLTVDCGIRPPEPIAQAQAWGLDVIVTDHHTPGPELPPARAVVNPKRADDPYPAKELAGVGVAFKLAQALVQRLAPERADALRQFLDLVALGTVADVVPLTGENRYWVRAGLHQLRQPQRQGLRALIGVAGLQPERIHATHIGFILGPRLNAAGRLDSAMAALRLLLTDDLWEAGQLAQQLEAQNRRRQYLTDQIVRAAETMAVSDPDNPPWLIFAAHPDFSLGVVGLAAARLVERYHRPTLIAHQEGELLRGSGRSIPGLHLTHALDQCREYLLRYGGHAAAAGFTLAIDRLPAFLECLQATIRQKLQGQDLRPTLRADAEVTLAQMTPEFLHQLRWFEPTGMGNPRPRFIVRGARLQQVRAMGTRGQHLRFWVDDGTARRKAVAFRQGHWAPHLAPAMDLLFTLEWDTYNGQYDIQLNVRDMRPARPPETPPGGPS